MLARIEKLGEVDQVEYDTQVLTNTEEELLHPTQDTVNVMVHYSGFFALRHTFQQWPNGTVKEWGRPLLTQLRADETWEIAAARMIKDRLLLWAELTLRGRLQMADRMKKQEKMKA